MKVPNRHIPKPLSEDDEDEDYVPRKRNQPLRTLQDLDGYATVFMPGSSASFIIKSAAGPPQIIGVAGTPIQNLSPLRSLSCASGFIYIDSEVNLSFFGPPYP